MTTREKDSSLSSDLFAPFRALEQELRDLAALSWADARENHRRREYVVAATARASAHEIDADKLAACLAALGSPSEFSAELVEAMNAGDWQRATHLLIAKVDALYRGSPSEAWQPIETAPRHERVFFWVVPKTAEESYTDTSGNPIVGKFAPYRHEGEYGSWSALSKAIYWMPLPAPPARPAEPREIIEP